MTTRQKTATVTTTALAAGVAVWLLLPAAAPQSYSRPTRITVHIPGPFPSWARHMGVSNLVGGTSQEYDIAPGDIGAAHEVWFNVTGTNFAMALWQPYFR